MSVRVDYRCRSCGGLAEHRVSSPPPPEMRCVACGAGAKRVYGPVGQLQHHRSAPESPPARATSGRPGAPLCATNPDVPGLCHLVPAAARMWLARARGDNRALEAEIARQEQPGGDRAPTAGPSEGPNGSHHHHEDHGGDDHGQGSHAHDHGHSHGHGETKAPVTPAAPAPQPPAP